MFSDIDRNDLHFFGHFKIISVYDRKKTASHMRHQNSSFIYFHVRFCSGNGHGGAVLRGIGVARWGKGPWCTQNF